MSERPNRRKMENLRDRLKRLDPFTLITDFLSVTGSTIYGEKATDDFDCVIRCDVEGDDLVIRLDRGLMLKAYRALEEVTDEKAHFIPSTTGPNWDHVPIADLMIVPKGTFDYREVLDSHLIRKGASDPLDEAETSASKNRVAAGKFFYPMRPAWAIEEGGRRTLDFLADLFGETDFSDGVRVEKKYDGLHVILMKASGKVRIVTDDGSDCTDRFPELAEKMASLERLDGKPSSLTLAAAIEIWKDGLHCPREDVAGYLHSKSAPDERGVVANVFDLLFEDGTDLRESPLQVRLDHLGKYKFPQSTTGEPRDGLNITPGTKVSSRAALKSACRKLSDTPGSKGAVVKRLKAGYSLKGGPSDAWVKFHKNTLISGIVLDRKEADTRGVYNYLYGVSADHPATPRELRGKVYEEVGPTLSTNVECVAGEVIEVEVEKVNVSYEDSEVDLTVQVPRFIGKAERRIPDSVEDVMDRAEKEGILVIRKEKASSEWPSGGDKEYDYVVQHHYRGKSAHADLRIDHDGYLIGWTLMNQKPGKITKPVTTLQEAVRIDRDPGNFKINWKTGEFDQRRTAAGVIQRTNIRCAPKKRELAAWINVEGVTEPGEVGATEQYPGVFHIVDKGRLIYGAIKPSFHEYFVTEGALKGRILFRQIGQKSAAGQGTGGAETCSCHLCDTTIPHDRGIPCNEIQCPFCGNPMSGVALSAAKLDVETFRAEGVDEDLTDPKNRWPELFADLRYLGNSGYPRLKEGQEWGEWDSETLLKYYARVVDVLRSVHFPIMPPPEGDKLWDTSYWEAYRDAKEYMESAPPETEDVADWNRRRDMEIAKKGVVLPPGEEEADPRTPFYWIMMKPKDETPYVLTKNAVDKNWMPPKGFSCLPPDVERHIPLKYRFWKMSDRGEARQARDELVEGFELHELGVPETKMRAPFKSPGGKSKVAKQLVAKFPPHKIYVEPFAGAASCLYAKDPSEREVLADIDPDVVNAHQVIKGLTDEHSTRLQGMDWACNRSNYERAKSTDPGEDALLRFWRFKIELMNSWAGDRSGYWSQEREGWAGVSRLSEFHERLKDVVVEKTSWEATLEKWDSPDTFFFLDPPYPGEKDVFKGNGAGPTAMDLARALKGLEGSFMLTISDNEKHREIFKDFNLSAYTVMSRRALPEDTGGRRVSRGELLVTSYKTAEKATSKFRLLRRWWSGQSFKCREGFGLSTELWDFIVKSGDSYTHFELIGNPLEGPVSAAEISGSTEAKRLMELSGSALLEPGSDSNPAGKSPAWVSVEANGSAVVLEDSATVKKFDLEGDAKDSLLIVRDEEDSQIWVASTERDSPDVKKMLFRFEIAEKQEDEQIVGGIVYEPQRYDTHADWASEEVIRQAMYFFMEHGLKFSIQHESFFDARVLECFQAEEDTKKGGRTIRKGSWYMTLRIGDPEVWELIKSNEISGFSWEGKVLRRKGQPLP